MMRFYIFILLTTFLGVACEETQTHKDVSYKVGELVWQDEFEVNGLPDSTKWSYSVGDGCPNLCGWGNDEAQYYTANDTTNCRVENGHLIIEAHKKTVGESSYTSAKIVTKEKASWLYKRVEVSAKLPKGVGLWPAIWLLPEEKKYGGWPKSGEIDIMEYVGFEPSVIHGTVHTEAFNHTKGTQKGKKTHFDNVEDDFHVYAVEWTEEKIDFYLDDNKYYTVYNDFEGSATYPFDHPFYLILNIAVGGSWGGRKGIDDDIFPQQMSIDYVRVYDLIKQENE